MAKIEYQSNGQPFFITLEDLKTSLGYKAFKPRIGSLGKALIKATKRGNHRSVSWLKKQLDELLKNNYKNKGHKKWQKKK
jgi:hypothetical protein